MKTSIIILSYNTKELLKNCLQSLYRQISSEEFEVIVVDNNSNDDSVEMLKKDFPQVDLIINRENAGFSKGCNVGAKNAKGDYLLFLNSDTEFIKSDTIEVLKKSFNDLVGVVGGLMHNTDGSLQRSFGTFYTIPYVSKMIFLGEKGELVGVILDKVKEVDWVSGGFMMIKRSIFEEMGGFDENIFMYVEDVELCYRIKKAGYKILMNPDAKVKHVGHGSSNRTFAIVQIYVGLSYFYNKHRNRFEYMILQILLRIKAYYAIIFGTMVRKPELIARYKKALASL